MPFAARIRKEVGIKTWAVGVITEPEQAERIVATGEADCTVHARPSCSTRAGPGTPPARSASRRRRLPLPAARAATILPFKPQPAMARAAD